jgi:glucosamine--fructose-6-phosphate aminotransferase (isomerizing)
MTSPAQAYAPRPWIRAAESFAAQPAALVALPAMLADQLSALPPRPSRVLFLGIGASHAAAASGTHSMRSHGIDASRHLPGELAGLDVADLVIATSQSGRSAEVVEAVTAMEPSRVLAVTNYRPSPLGDLAGHALNLGDHADSAVSFLSFTSTLVAFGMISDYWRGSFDLARWEGIVSSALESAQGAETSLRAAAGLIAEQPFVDFVAPAPLASAAEEAALMFREGPLIGATGMETRLYLHGPMDVAGSAAHVVIGAAREALLIEQLAERTRSLVFVRTDDKVAIPAAATSSATMDVGTDPIGQAVAATIMAQYLALRVAEQRGVDIDAPVFTRLDTKTSAAPR